MTRAPAPIASLALPVLAAPMAGGPGTPQLVIAAARAESLGFLAGGYKRPAELAGQIATVRAAGVGFGVNLFAPSPLPVEPAAYRRYASALAPEAERLGVELPTEPREDDDHWREKVDLLLAEPVALISFTFGIPEREVLSSLRRAGSVTIQTVTSEAEAEAADAAGLDALVVQSAAGGGHSAVLDPSRPPPLRPLPDLVAAVRTRTSLPLLATGGIGEAHDVRAALGAGACAVLVGTALMLADEAGTTPAHRDALASGDRETVVTRAFTGRPARGLRNKFIDSHEADAPLGYPAINHLTSPIRKAAAAAGDPEALHLWAGTGYRTARSEPTAAILARLSEWVP